MESSLATEHPITRGRVVYFLVCTEHVITQLPEQVIVDVVLPVVQRYSNLSYGPPVINMPQSDIYPTKITGRFMRLLIPLCWLYLPRMKVRTHWDLITLNGSECTFWCRPTSESCCMYVKKTKLRHIHSADELTELRGRSVINGSTSFSLSSSRTQC
jgi:hypothetical protein